MSVRGVCVPAKGREAAPFWSDEDVVEVTLLLSARQAEALEELAHARGLTAAELVRGLLREHLTRARPRMKEGSA